MLLMEHLNETMPGALETRLKFTPVEGMTGAEMLETACRKRGWLLPGARLDTERAASLILDEFRGGKMGRITLEAPPARAGAEG